MTRREFAEEMRWRMYSKEVLNPLSDHILAVSAAFDVFDLVMAEDRPLLTLSFRKIVT